MSSKKAVPIKEWIGAFDAFKHALYQMKANPGPALLYTGIYLACYLLESIEPGLGTKDSLTRASAYETFAYLIFLLAIPTYALAIADKKRIELNDFMHFSARKYFSTLGATILYGLIVIFSLIALVVPAVWTIAWFSLCIYLVVDQGLGPIEALKQSKRLIQDHKSKVWGLIGVTILLSFGSSLVTLIPGAGAVLGPVSSALIVLLSSGATAMLYRWAQQRSKI